MKVPNNILVLGGGITGLSSAFHLARSLPPSSRIVLLERSHRTGGWIQSTQQDDNTNVALEAGPRTLRPDSHALIELIHLLDLSSSLLTVQKSHPAAKARYINFPPLTLLPSSLPSLLASPFLPNTPPPLRSLLPSILRESFRTSNRPPAIQDESLHSFVSRRFGNSFAHQFLSSIIHGIYAADSRHLSVRAAFPFLWDAEERGAGSVVRGFIRNTLSSFLTLREAEHDYQVGDVKDKLKDTSIYTFKGGMETLSNALYNWLDARPNVQIHRGLGATSIRPVQNGIEVQTTNANSSIPPFVPDHVISTIPLKHLHSIIPSHNSLPHLTHNPSSTVLVVNLTFPPTPTLLHPPGFGYLIPRPLDDYPPSSSSLSSEQSEKTDDISYALLGTIFDSAITSPASHSSSQLQMTRLTCMLGGPYALPTPLPSPDAFLPSLLTTLSKHLSTHLPQPTRVEVRVQKEAIPTYAVGHLDRMSELREALSDPRGVWRGRMDVIGSGVGGVSLGDCVSAGREVALRLARRMHV